MLPTPYQGRDVMDIEAEVSASYRDYNRRLPAGDLNAFNPNVKTFGQPWAEVHDIPAHGLVVIAGLSGNMSGVAVAVFATNHEAAAKAYARDFEQGKAFAIIGGDNWKAFVKAAHDAKPLDSAARSQLLAMGRTEGITSDGRTVGAVGLQAIYARKDQ